MLAPMNRDTAKPLLPRGGRRSRTYGAGCTDRTAVQSPLAAVPVRSANGTTAFDFSYTFTDNDARIGKATFTAVATIVDARDALPGANEAVASPTKAGH